MKTKEGYERNMVRKFRKICDCEWQDITLIYSCLSTLFFSIFSIYLIALDILISKVIIINGIILSLLVAFLVISLVQEIYLNVYSQLELER